MSSTGTSDDLSRILECPYCCEVTVPPVYQCSSGHLACSNCVGKLKHCGYCKAPVTGRSLLYDNLFEKLTIPCKYAEEGCKEAMLGKFLKEHQDLCDFRPVQCIHLPCVDNEAGTYDGAMDYSTYLKHLEEVHQLYEFNTGKTGTIRIYYQVDDGNVNDPFRKFAGVQLEGNTFLKAGIQFQGELGIWFYYFGAEADAKKFVVKLTIENKSANNLYAISWEGPVHSVRKPFTTIIDEGECLNFSARLAKKLLIRPEHHPYYEVKYKIKEVDSPWTVIKPGTDVSCQCTNIASGSSWQTCPELAEDGLHGGSTLE